MISVEESSKMLRLIRYYFASGAVTRNNIDEARSIILANSPATEKVHDLLPDEYHSRLYRELTGWSYTELAEIRWLLIERNASSTVIDKWKGVE
jgi:hypothetical protein